MKQEANLRSAKSVRKNLAFFIRNINAKGIQNNNLNIRCRRAVCQNCANHHGPVLGEGGYSK